MDGEEKNEDEFEIESVDADVDVDSIIKDEEIMSDDYVPAQSD